MPVAAELMALAPGRLKLDPDKTYTRILYLCLGCGGDKVLVMRKHGPVYIDKARVPGPWFFGSPPGEEHAVCPRCGSRKLRIMGTTATITTTFLQKPEAKNLKST